MIVIVCIQAEIASMPAHPPVRWLSRVERGEGPIYLAVLRALEAAIRAGELHPGDQLPPQRAVAELLGVDFTTVTRAYSAARSRGLVEGAVGRGTFVSARALDDDPGLADLSMNLPPPPDGLSLGALLRDATNAVLQRTDAATLMSYHPGAGTLGQKAAGARWLAPCLGEVAPERVLVSQGAQTALAAALAALTRPGDAVVVEPLTYPGLKAAAGQLGLRLVSCATDAEGLRPEALRRICAEQAPAALYLVPTLQNPTALTMPSGRRREVADVAQASGLWIIEDDPYSRLLDAPPPAVATFAPARTVYVSTLSKCLSPGLRLAYVVCPEGLVAARVAESLRAIGLMPPPLTAAVVTAWIRDGAADELLAGVRREARARRAAAALALPEAQGEPESIHVWLPLPAVWRPESLRLAAQEQGLSLVTAEAFAVGPEHETGVRISLGGPARRAVLAEALNTVAGLLRQAPADRLVV
jgi:DNA-binding transcriptional MocR family regulator